MYFEYYDTQFTNPVAVHRYVVFAGIAQIFEVRHFDFECFE